MAAGDSPVISKPRLWIAPVGTALPSLTLGSYGNWPTGWLPVLGYTNGLTVTIQNPKAAIQTSDLGIIGYVGTGADGVQVQGQTKLPIASLMKYLNSFTEVDKAVQAGSSVSEVRTITFATNATSAGVTTVTVDGYSQSVNVLNSGTPTTTASAVSALTWPGWTTVPTVGAVAFTATGAGAHSGTFSTSTTATGQTGSWATTTPGTQTAPQTYLWGPDPNQTQGGTSEFMVGIEGVADAGSLYDAAKIMRFIAFRAQQGGNIANRWDHTGADAGMYPSLTLQALRHTLTAAQVNNTGLQLADFRTSTGGPKYDRCVWMNIATS